MKAKDLTGQKFGRLKAVKKLRRYNGNRWHSDYLCECDCGKIAEVRGDQLTREIAKSCGCLHREITGRINRGRPTATLTHGLSHSRLYKVFRDMKTRCYNSNSPDFKNYGGRGITICDEWLNDFSVFYKWAYENGYDETAPKMACTIDRIDNDKGYSPQNCRWVDIATQNQNRRKRGLS